MSLTCQKFLATGALGIVLGFIAGFFLAARFAGPIEPIVVDGRTLEVCGQMVVAQSIVGGLAGAPIGLVVGLAAAWWLPTPGRKLSNQDESLST